MERILPNKIELVLLHDSFELMDPNILLKLINEFAAGYELSFERTRHEKLPNYFHFSGQNSTIEIDYVEEPVVGEAFSTALQASHVRRKFPEAESIVENHKSYVHICIWNEIYEPADPITEEQPPLPPSFDGVGFDTAVSLLRMVSAIHINHTRPLAVYWVQSDRLLRVPEYLQLAIDFKNQSLLVNPYTETFEDLEEGQQLTALKTVGAQNLVGKELRFDPVPMPESELYDCALHFVSMTRGTGLLIPDRDVFGRSEDEVIRVHHVDDSETGSPIIRMVVEYSQQFGIGEAQPETETEGESEAFDLDDPTEKAMHEKIEAMRKLDEPPELASEAEVADFSEELGQESEWKGVQRKVDISSLRTLATSSGLVESASEEETGAKNIMTRVSGLFQRGQKT